jgi:cytochrome c oxidase assembly protein subunit 15
MGGLVTSKQAGMSVPDWPNSYGYNMFLFPPSQWVGGILYEHVHRLKGTIVGFLAGSLMLCAWAPSRSPTHRRRIGWITLLSLAGCAVTASLLWFARTAEFVSYDVAKHLSHIPVAFGSIALFAFVAYICRNREERRWVRWMTIVTFILVCIQGTLGGLRVELIAINLAVVHACLAQAFFCIAGLMVAVTSTWWLRAKSLGDTPLGSAGAHTFRIALVLVVAIFVQLVLGALMRHHGAGLAIPDLPLAYGKLLPPTNAADLTAINEQRAWSMNLPMVTHAQVWLHFAHRIGALVVAGIVLWLLWQTSTRCRPLRAAAWTTVALVAIQFTLGVYTVLLKKPADVATAHVAVGALTLLFSFLVAIVAFRLFIVSGTNSRTRVPASNPPQSSVLKGAVV